MSAEVKFKKINRNYEWTNEEEKLLVYWNICSKQQSALHDLSYVYYRKRAVSIIIPVIALSTLVGSANFAVNMVPPEFQNTVNGIIGALSIVVAIINGATAVLRYSELQEKHKFISTGWKLIQQDIIVINCIPYELRSNSKQFMDKMNSKIKILIEQTPLIPKPILKKYTEKTGEVIRDMFDMADIIKGMHLKYDRLYPTVNKQVVGDIPVPEQGQVLAKAVAQTTTSDKYFNMKSGGAVSPELYKTINIEMQTIGNETKDALNQTPQNQNPQNQNPQITPEFYTTKNRLDSDYNKDLEQLNLESSDSNTRRKQLNNDDDEYKLTYWDSDGDSRYSHV